MTLLATDLPADLLLPGYRVDPVTAAWMTLPWPEDPEEKELLIRHSLGPGIIEWAEWQTSEPGLIHYLTGQQWRFTPGQKRFIIMWYHVDPTSGRFTWRRGVKRGAKGTGKDPFAGALGDAELCGPVELYDWDDKHDRPVGTSRGLPLIQVASNSEDQSKDLLRVANAMWGKEARSHYGIVVGEKRTLLRPNGGRFEVTTASEASSEGDPATFSILNETHHMTTTSGGKKLARVARRNVGKSPASIQARSLEFTNAHRQGGDSVAEDSYLAWQKQQAPGYPGGVDILYDSIEAPPDTDILTYHGRLRGVTAAYMDAPWADLERTCGEMVDPDTPVADTIRYYLNGLGTEEDAWVEPGKWDLLAAPRVVEDGTQIAMFLDCSKSGDATALMGCTLDTYVFTIGIWQRPHGLPKDTPWLAPRAEVDAAVRAARERWNLVWFGVDPSPAKDDDTEAIYWQVLIDGWARDFLRKLRVWATPGQSRGNPVLFDMRMSTPGSRERLYKFTKCAELVQKWVDEEGLVSPLRHDGNPIFRTHVHNAKARPNEWGTSLSKVTRDSSRHVDAAVAAVGAILGSREALGSGKVRQRRPGARSGSGGRRITVYGA